MEFTRLIIDNFRCFKHLEVDFALNSNIEDPVRKGGLTVFVAENGNGKTAILEALRYLLAPFIARFSRLPVPRIKDSDYRDEWSTVGAREGEIFRRLPRAPFMRIGATARFADTDSVRWDVVVKRDKTVKLSDSPVSFEGTRALNQEADNLIIADIQDTPKVLPVFAYYNTERAVIRNKPVRRRGFQKAFSRYDAYIGALDAGLNYKKTIEWLCYVEYKQDQEMKNVKDWGYRSIELQTIQLAFDKMLPGFSNLRTIAKPLDLAIDVNDGTGTPKVCRVDTQLSDGYKIVLVLVLDLVSRILEANAVLQQMTPEKLLASEGVVLIDEVDLHLHPSWQQRILPDLQRTFPNMQFIVTTHSPQIVSSVPKECVRIIANNQVEPFDMETQGVESQNILAGIFGTNPAPENDVFVKMLNDYAEMEINGKADSPEGQKLLQNLREHYGNQYAPLERIEIHRKFLSRRKGEKDA